MTKRIIFAAIIAALAGLSLSGCAGLKDDRDTYTITFDSAYSVYYTPPSGSTEAGWTKYNETPETIQTNTLGRLPRMPSDPVRQNSDEYFFGGWFTAGGTAVTIRTVFTSDITVFARWDTTDEGYKALTNWLRATGDTIENGETYNYTVLNHETMTPQALDYPGMTGITIKLTGQTMTIAGESQQPIVKLANMGSLFTIGEGVTLEIDNIWLEGTDRNTDALIIVNKGGRLIIRQGAGHLTKLYGNGGEDMNSGGGIQVNAGGEFELWGGEISNNLSFDASGQVGYRGRGGGGVLVRGGTFSMYGGKIYKNDGLDGGGVFVNYDKGGVASANPYDPYITIPAGMTEEQANEAAGNAPKQGFFMYGGEIFENHVANSGGGICNNYHAYSYIYSGKIYGNTGWAIAGITNGGHLEFGRRGGTGYKTHTITTAAGPRTFTETAPEVYGNEGGYGGGVDSFDLGCFIMWDGAIRDNTADGSGGGVSITSVFLMHGGVISGNKSNTGVGGGVYITPPGAFFMSGGTVYGKSAAAGSLSNSHESSQQGNALFFSFNIWDEVGTAYYGELPPHGNGKYINFPFFFDVLPGGGIDGKPKTAMEATDRTITVVNGVLTTPATITAETATTPAVIQWDGSDDD